MTDEVRGQLEAAGVDVKSVLERFMNNESLLERFMKKFKADPNYQELQAAIEAKDNDRAFKAAHTLKGVSGNLSLISLQTCVSKQCEMFRAGDFEAGATMMPEVKEEYERITQVIDKVYP